MKMKTTIRIWRAGKLYFYWEEHMHCSIDAKQNVQKGLVTGIMWKIIGFTVASRDGILVTICADRMRKLYNV